MSWATGPTSVPSGRPNRPSRHSGSGRAPLRLPEGVMSLDQDVERQPRPTGAYRYPWHPLPARFGRTRARECRGRRLDRCPLRSRTCGPSSNWNGREAERPVLRALTIRHDAVWPEAARPLRSRSDTPHSGTIHLPLIRWRRNSWISVNIGHGADLTAGSSAHGVRAPETIAAALDVASRSDAFAVSGPARAAGVSRL